MKLLVSLSASVYWYGLQARPFGPGQVPDGHSKYMSPEDTKNWPKLRGIPPHRYRHGLVGYPTQLADRTVQAFELQDIFGHKEPDFGGTSKESKVSVLEYLVKELEEKVEYLDNPFKASRIAGTMVTMSFAHGKPVKFGFKGNNVAVLGVNKSWSIKDKHDADEAVLEIFYEIEDAVQ